MIYFFAAWTADMPIDCASNQVCLQNLPYLESYEESFNSSLQRRGNSRAVAKAFLPKNAFSTARLLPPIPFYQEETIRVAERQKTRVMYAIPRLRVSSFTD